MKGILRIRIEAAALLAALALAAGGCGPAPGAEAPRAAPAPTADASQGVETLAFVDRVWVVEESNSVANGSTRVFLSGGTLALVDPGATPAFGRWKLEEGRLTVVEEGIAYPVDLDELRGDTMRITLRGPGEPVRMTMRDARPRIAAP